MAEYFELFCILGFLIQLFLCFKVKNVWVRMVPLFGIMGCMAICAGLYLAKSDLYYMAYLVIWGLILLASESAWIVCAMVKVLKKAKKYL